MQTPTYHVQGFRHPDMTQVTLHEFAVYPKLCCAVTTVYRIKVTKV